MFSNGKFKNIVAMIDSKEDCPIRPGASLVKTFVLNPAKGVTKNWIALEDSYVKASSSLASTVVCSSAEERNVFAIYVSYYVKVKLVVGAIGSKLSMKLPFTLMPSQMDTEMMEQLPDRYSPTQMLSTDQMNLDGPSCSNPDAITVADNQSEI